MAFSIISEALARIEHKIDIILSTLKPIAKVAPLSFFNLCPVCNQLVEHQIDLQANVVKRRCGCSTGVSPSVVPLFNTQPKGTQDGNGRPAPAAGAAEDGD